MNPSCEVSVKLRVARTPGIVRRGLAIIGLGIRTQPRSFAVAVVGAALFGGMTVTSAVVLGRVTDRVIEPAITAGEVSVDALLLGCGAIVAVSVLKVIGIILRRVGAAFMQLKLEAIFRERVTSRYTRLPLFWHQRHSTGELLSTANADVEAT